MAIVVHDKNDKVSHYEGTYDNKLSLKAQAIYNRLAVDEGCSISIGRICGTSRDGVDSVKAGLRELERAGYLTRRVVRDVKGRFDHMEYIIRGRAKEVI